MQCKFGELIPQYNGESDFSNWIVKLELVARLQKVEELEAFLPLFLTGGALAVYTGLSTETQNNYVKLKAALTEAFSINQGAAYAKLVARRLQPNDHTHFAAVCKKQNEKNE